MKGLFCICLLLSSTLVQSQNEISYSDLLKRTREISIHDSFYVDVESVEHTLLDTNALKLFFYLIYPPLTTTNDSPMEYFISGKITVHPNFDMLLVTTRKKIEDKSLFEHVYLITSRKDGSNINTLGVAMRRIGGNNVNASAWLHKDFKVFVTTRINNIKGKEIGGLTEYRINEDGRFVHYPHW